MLAEFTTGKYSKLSASLDVQNDKQAKKLAKQIFLAICGYKEGEIKPSDFKAYVFWACT